MKSFQFELKTKMIFGEGSALSLGLHLKELGFKSPCFVVDKNIFFTDYVNKIYKSFDELDAQTILYEHNGEPTYEYLEELRKQLKTDDIHHPKYPMMIPISKYDCFIAIGGGSVIDTAKGLALLSTNPFPAIQYRGFPKDVKPPIPVIAIPTTAGTGSEVTFNAVFIDASSKKKLGINSRLNYPVLAVLDPNLILTCPKTVMLSSALDALTHAVESYGATKSNEFTRLLSRRALLHFRYSLPDLRSWKDLSEESRLRIASDLQLGAYYAGIALMNSGSGPAGALSYILGTKYNVPHGLAGGVFLPHIIDFNEEHGFRYTDFSDECISFKSLFASLDFNFNNLHQFGVNNDNAHLLYEGVDTLQPAFDQNPIPFTTNYAKQIIRRMI